MMPVASADHVFEKNQHLISADSKKDCAHIPNIKNYAGNDWSKEPIRMRCDGLFCMLPNRLKIVATWEARDKIPRRILI